MLQFNNNHIFTGYLKQFLASFNLPVCRIYTTKFEKYFNEHGIEHPEVIESNAPILLHESSRVRSATNVIYLKNSTTQQYFWDTSSWSTARSVNNNKVIKYWTNPKAVFYNGNKILGLTKTLTNDSTLYNYQTHEYLGDYLRFMRDYENINLMPLYNCFSNRLCNNLKFKLDWQIDYQEINKITNKHEPKKKAIKLVADSYDPNYKIYMVPVKLFESYTIAIDCYKGVEMFCGLYNEKLDTSTRAKNLIKKTYTKISKTRFNQPILYDKLQVKHWNWSDENLVTDNTPSTVRDLDQFTRAELATLESSLKLFIKIPATNNSSIAILAGNYCNFNDSLFTIDRVHGCTYKTNSAILNFETKNTYKASSLPDLNSREFTPISKLQLLALNTGISYPFSDRLLEYLVANVILPNDPTTDNIVRVQKIMEDCGYTFLGEGIWEPKMQMILYDYLMNSGKFVAKKKTSETGVPILNSAGHPTYKVTNERLTAPDKVGDLVQRGRSTRADFYDVLGFVDKDAEKLYASWVIDNSSDTVRVVAKNTLENIDLYPDLYNK